MEENEFSSVTCKENGLLFALNVQDGNSVLCQHFEIM